MKLNTIDINEFERNSSFYGQIPLLLTIKNFDLAAIRARYIKSLDNVSGRAGSVERREAGEGGLASLIVSNGGLTDSEVLVRLKEPRGIDVNSERLAFSSEAHVYIVSDENIDIIEDPWFSYIHTVNFSPWDENKILVSSSGFDCIFEFDLGLKSSCYEWFAWEHGFDKGLNPETGLPYVLTRDPEKAEKFKAEGIDYRLIVDPAAEVLPTASRAAFINSVEYDKKNESVIIATFFHEGKVYSIDRDSSEASVLIDGLEKPHGGRNYGAAYMATSTATGDIVTGSAGNLTQLSLNNLPGKPEFLKDLEWVQNTVAVGDIFIAIDSNRTSFVIVDPIRKLYDIVPYDENWAVQDAVVGELNGKKKQLIASLS